MRENEMVLSGGAELAKQSELFEPMLYYGSKECYEYLVVRDDLGELVNVLDVHGNKSEMSVQRMRVSMNGGSVYGHAAWATKSIEATVAEFGKDLPESWRDAIQQISPRLLESNS